MERRWPMRRRKVFSTSKTSVLLALMLLLICSVVGVLLYGARKAEFRRASMEASNLSATIVQDLARTIELYDLSLQGVMDGLADQDVMASSAKLRQMILFDRATSTPSLGSILVIDETGRIIADSRSLVPKPVNVADRAYFKVHRDRADVGLYISEPFASRVSHNVNIALTRRINKPDGSFGGVVVGTIRLAYIENLLKSVRLGSGLLMLARQDGSVVTRQPPLPGWDGIIERSSSVFDHLIDHQETEFQAKCPIDGLERLFNRRQVGSLPLVLFVGLSVEEIYSDWWLKAVGISLVLATCCAIIGVLAARLHSELDRRTKAEATLTRLAEEDSLTGIANRRLFDKVLDWSWRVAARRRAPISLLMIDIDQFKSFNDTFGHPAGDKALADVGGRLKETFRQTDEITARYGGEEFAVILPFTDGEGAMVAAERVRLAIADLAIAHPGSPSAVLSISVGVATAVPSFTAPVAELVAAADAALYAAKKGGRNCSKWTEAAVETIAVRAA